MNKAIGMANPRNLFFKKNRKIPYTRIQNVNVLQNIEKTISNLLDNDQIIDGAIITSIDNSQTNGTIVLSNNKTVLYTPQSGFLGNDTFTYTICDDDSPINSCSTATVTITVIQQLSFNIPSGLTGYYNNVVFSEDQELMFNELSEHTTAKHSIILSYGQRHQYLYNADEDQNNTDNVILPPASIGASKLYKQYSVSKM